MSDKPRPPERVQLVFCPVCGRDDRYTNLKRKAQAHYAYGSRCEGAPVVLTYVLSDQM